ncbi:c-type cytochrome [Neptuniibacter halophilus]|uniref:c-type cytochrome n=1 Tax=Neptuniibacter halophilus TaxID=651666 RepID=UPI00257451C5|nr:cytochrome c [Neptuniibacter halophilus]
MRPTKLSLTLLGSLLLTGCFDEDPAQLSSGEDLYAYYCKNCHQQEGAGAYLENLSNQTHMEHYKIILMIKYGYNQDKHPMPVFNQLSEAQADAVARYVVGIQLNPPQ